MGPAQGHKVGSVFIEIEGRKGAFSSTMQQAKTEAQAAGASITGVMTKVQTQTRVATASMGASIRGVNGEIDGLKAQFLSLKNIIIAIAAGAGVKAFNDMADEFSLMRSRIRLVTQEGESLYEIEDKLARQAFVNRASLKETVALYTRLRQSREDLTDAVTQNLVDKWSKTLIISASSATEAASSTMQFAQAMSAGVLAGQELRSVIQGNSAFAVSLAKGLGVTTGALKQMGEEGKLTTDVIIAAIDKAGDSIEHDFSKKALTVHQAMTNLETATLRVLGSIDQAFGISSGNAQWLNNMAQALDDLTAVMGGPAKEAEVAISRLNAANVTVKADLDSLTHLHEKLDEAIRSGGEAAVYAARLEIDAVNRRIAKNRELSGVYEAQARAKLAEANAELDRKVNGRAQGFEVSDLAMRLANVPMAAQGKTAFQLYGYGAYHANQQSRIDSALGAPLQRLDKAMAEIARMQELKIPLSDAQNELIKFALGVADVRAAVESSEKSLEALASGGTLPAPASGAPTGSASVAATAKQVEILSGYMSELEQLNQSLADIEKARSEGAQNTSRAAMQAMLDYLNATDDVLGVLLRIREVQGGILNDADAASLSGMIAAMEMGNFMSGPDAARALGGEVGQIDTNAILATQYTFEGAEAEARMAETIANATKQGLIWGIESGDWGDVFASILTDAVRESLSAAVDVLFEALSQIDWGQLLNGVSGGTGWGGLFAALGAGFMGGGGSSGGISAVVGGSFKNRAGGGPVAAGDMVRVGELGSEWFVPNKDGFIIPAGGMKARSAIMPVSIGETHLHVNGLANGVTIDQMEAALDAHRRALPAAIDRRVADRLQRGAY